MGLFDGAFDPIGSGILPAWAMTRDQPGSPDMPPWLTNTLANLQQGMPSGMNFNDRFGPASGAMQPGGAFDRPIMADPGLQQVSPQAMQAWRQGVDNGGITPTTTPLDANGRPVGESPMLPPGAQPAMGQGMPAGPAMGRGMLGLGAPPPAAVQQAAMGQNASPGPLDRLSAAGAGFFNAGSPMEAIGNLIGGAVTGKRQDARGYGQEYIQQVQAETYQALRQSGVPEGQAKAAALNPEVFKAVAAEHFGGPKIVQIGESIGGGKQFGVMVGGKLMSLDAFAKQGGAGAPGNLGTATDASGTPLQGPDYLEHIKKTDPSAAAMIEGILRGDASVSGRNLQKYMPEAQRVDPTFSQFTYDTRKKTAMDFAPSGKSALNVRSLETVGGHIDKMLSLFDNLDNTWNPTFNSVKNWLSVQAGKGQVNAFETAANGVANELGTVFRSFGMSDAEVKSWRDRIAGSSSPEAFREGMSTLLDMLKTRKEAIAEQYTQGLGKPPPPEMFQKLDAAIAKIEGKLSGKAAETKTEPKQLSARDKEAMDWANANPSDPRAAAIKQKLGVK